ncbi:MAG: hypothetical protein BGO41_06015 [Clostridiales bacterium 38-18]|nr:MAG: hypothetical protein BGO41_06015 [Clostridiales bacterium 38-18]
MIFALIVMAIIAKVLYGKGYGFEKMLPYLIIGGIVALIFPIGKLIVLPFEIIGSVFGAVFGGLGGAFGGVIGGIFGVIGGLIGAVFGIIGATLGIVFGAIGIVFGIITVVIIPLLIIFFVLKLVVH